MMDVTRLVARTPLRTLQLAPGSDGLSSYQHSSVFHIRCRL